MKNNSPWIFELNPDRKTNKICYDEKTDVTIVGAGIAGIATAFFTLENTDKNVILVDKYKLAHGATGHNAGQVVAYFERPYGEIVEEFGLAMASAGHRDIEDAWDLIEHMYKKAELKIPFPRFIGHAAFSDKEVTFKYLERNRLFKEGGVPVRDFFIEENVSWLDEAKQKYDGLFKVVTHEVLLEKLETKNKKYIACVSVKEGCLNSARFCEEILEYLLKKYGDRFSFYEYTPIVKIVLKENYALLDADTNTIETKFVILCTNGFEHFEIFNKAGLDIDTKFHHDIEGIVGYMSAYIDSTKKNPFAISYYDNCKNADPYFYVTRREYDGGGKNKAADLVSIGGPEIVLENRREYDREYEYPEDAKEKLENFAKETYGAGVEKRIEHNFLWHGLMGYTPNMIRRIGPEPKNNILFYNLGCNGLGILPSVHGGYKISKMLAGEIFPPSIFDPK